VDDEALGAGKTTMTDRQRRTRVRIGRTRNIRNTTGGRGARWEHLPSNHRLWGVAWRLRGWVKTGTPGRGFGVSEGGRSTHLRVGFGC
jgi:hypothetical protein